MLAQFGPMIAKALTLPGNHGPRLDKDQSIPPPRPAACDPRPEYTVPGINSWAFGCSLIHSELMAESQDLGLQGDPRSKRREEYPQEEADHVEAPKMRGLISIVQRWYTECRSSRIATVSSFRERQVTRFRGLREPVCTIVWCKRLLCKRLLHRLMDCRNDMINVS